MEQKFLATRIANHDEFKQLALELKALVPRRDTRGRLHFRRLSNGERPLNRRQRREIARRLLRGETCAQASTN
jgi:hypothetical protein